MKPRPGKRCSKPSIDNETKRGHDDVHSTDDSEDNGSDLEKNTSASHSDLSSSSDEEPWTKKSLSEPRRNDTTGQLTQPVAPLPHGWGSRRMRSSNKRRKSPRPILIWQVWQEKMERFIDENFTADIDFDHQYGETNEAVETPSELTMPLLRYQKEWLAWALKQEQSAMRGGILADEMGMGKTIQAIALVLAKREALRVGCDPVQPSSSSGLPAVNATLVVCPVVGLSLWKSEIEQFTVEGSTKFLLYYGASRRKSSAQFANFDFVITTYSTVEFGFRKYMQPPKKKCPYCEKSFFEKKLETHHKYFCGPHAVRTAKQSMQEKRKVESKHEIGKSDKTKGARRKSSNQPDEESSEGKSILHSVKWKRIILDEAHYIKDSKCNTAKAIFALESSYRWALSGTPFQNRFVEVYSQIRFLQILPYSFYFCRHCDCRMLDFKTQEHSSSWECPHCPHSSALHFCWWKQFVAKKIRKYGNSGEGKRAMILLKLKILKSIMLRRNKKGRAADLALPPRIVSLRRDALDIKEEDYYESLYSESQAQFNTYIEAGTIANNYVHVFELLTRLRQAVNHPYLVVYSKATALRNESPVDGGDVEQICDFCHDTAEDPVVTSCSHVFCKACLLDFSSSLEQVSCPSCSKTLTVDFIASGHAGNQSSKGAIKGFKSSSILNRIRLEDFQTSTKIEALREEIRLMVDNDGSAKGIVFSQFTAFLDLIKYSLHKSGISCVQLDGSMSLPARDAAIKRFTEDSNCRIFLMSLKAGGVALNLTIASHVFIMDPWWNPALERQAQDRIHRIGQHKPIRIVRFVIENSVEERILKLQEKKELVFQGTVDASSEALGKLTVKELQFLFSTMRSI